jgi:hypothetical protein
MNIYFTKYAGEKINTLKNHGAGITRKRIREIMEAKKGKKRRGGLWDFTRANWKVVARKEDDIWSVITVFPVKNNKV